MRPFLVLGAILAALAPAQTSLDGRPSVVLDSGTAQVVIDLRGGSLVRFALADLPLNPLGWNNQGPATESRPMSHFLCADRWGQPSQAEEANGMPFHGEATRVEWQVVSATKTAAEMSARLPLAGLEITRRAELRGARLTVTESITNRNKLGRPYNFVQHPTIAPPFLDESTVVDANAKLGFMQASALPNPEQPQVVWPQALREDGSPVNLRHLTNDPQPNVVSYVIDESLGWVTAVHPARGLVLGYVWQTSDYPWLNIWRHVENGKPLARGLEFGTTGLHQPFPVLTEKARIFNRPLFAFLDAGETHTRSYVAFLARLPAGSAGIKQVIRRGGELVLVERNRTGETIVR